MEAKQAIAAPIKFNNINDKSVFSIFPITLRKYAMSIWKTPIKPIQSPVFIIAFLLIVCAAVCCKLLVASCFPYFLIFH